MYRTQEEIEELFEKYEKLVFSTVYERFGNPSYRMSHGLDWEELLQFGRMGLLRACKTYKKNSDFVFATHAIRNIVWSVNVESKRYSLGNVNKSSNELLDRVSMDEPIGSQLNHETAHDVVESYEEGFSEFEIKDLLQSIGSNISTDVSEIVKMRMEGLTFDEIATTLDISRQAVEQRLKRNRDKIVELYQDA